MSQLLKKAKNKDSEDIVYVVVDGKSRFIEGEEYVPVKWDEKDPRLLYIKKNSIVFSWKGM